MIFSSSYGDRRIPFRSRLAHPNNPNEMGCEFYRGSGIPGFRRAALAYKRYKYVAQAHGEDERKDEPCAFYERIHSGGIVWSKKSY
jgi:hypothetical protein